MGANLVLVGVLKASIVEDSFVGGLMGDDITMTRLHGRAGRDTLDWSRHSLVGTRLTRNHPLGRDGNQSGLTV